MIATNFFIHVKKRQSLVQFSDPIEITEGGVYSNLRLYSGDSLIPAINVLTTEAVEFVNCLTHAAGHHIKSGVAGTNITVTNSKGVGLTPTVSNTARGRYLSVSSPNSVTVQNCELNGTSGIYVLGNLQSGKTVKIIRNKATEIDGRDWTGAKPIGAGKSVQFVQLDQCVDMVACEIGWNQVVNTFGNSCVEDVINIYQSNGTSGDRILIHDNYIDGAYPLSISDHTFSGGGIIVDAAYIANVARYIDMTDNQVIRTTNYGIGIAGGNNCRILDNRIISLNKNADESASFWAGGNNGIQRYNHGSAPVEVFFGHTVTGNTVGWINQNTGIRQDFYGGGDTISEEDNNPIPGEEAAITRALENGELTLWQAKLLSNSVTIGNY
jgi:hypothetical protein